MTDLLWRGSIKRTYTWFFLCLIIIGLSLFVTNARAQNVPPSSTTTADQAAVTTDLGYTTDFVSSPGDKVVGDFVVGPGKSELTILPGTSKIIEITLTNRTGGLRQFNLEVEDATGSNDPATPVVLLGTDKGPYTLKDYVKVPRTSILLKQNERARIPVTISVPADAEPGGRYGSVLVTTVTKDAVRSEEGVAAPSSAIISRVGTLFFLTIPGNTDIGGQLQSFKTIADKVFFTQSPINFQILFENTGDLHLNPYGEIRITNIINEEVDFIELDPWFALPKSLRAREVVWSRELLVGRYTATAHINRGYDDVIDTQSVTFYVLPWKIVASVFGGIFVFLVLIRFITKNFEFKRKTN